MLDLVEFITSLVLLLIFTCVFMLILCYVRLCEGYVVPCRVRTIVRLDKSLPQVLEIEKKHKWNNVKKQVKWYNRPAPKFTTIMI